jgi:hypothetical protein
VEIDILDYYRGWTDSWKSLVLVVKGWRVCDARRPCDQKEEPMSLRNLVGATAFASALLTMIGGVAASEEAKYPDLKGYWRTTNRGLLAGGAGGWRWDESRPPSTATDLGQDPPLTPEYRAIYQADIADIERGGQGIDPTYKCVSPGLLNPGIRSYSRCHLHSDVA